MNKVFKLREFNIFLGVINGLFLIYYFFLAVYSRLWFDDYNFLKMVREEGVFNYLATIYHHHSGRFIYYFIDAIAYRIINMSGVYFYWPLLYLVFGIITIYFILKKYLPSFSAWTAFNIASLVVIVFIMTSYENVIFFQICGSVYYIMPVFLLMALSVINLREKSNTNYLFLLLLGIILGGIHEAFTPCCLFLFGLNWIYYFSRNNFSFKKAFSDDRIRYLTFIMAVMLVGFIIVMIAPGNYANAATNHDYDKAHGILDLLKRSVKIYAMYFYFFAFRIPYYLFLVVVFTYLGFKSKDHLKLGNKYFKWILFFIPVYLVYGWMVTLTNAYMMPRFGIYRIYTHANFLTVAAFCIFSFLFGFEKLSKDYYPKLRIVLFTSLSIMVVCMAVNIMYDIPKAKRYAESDKKRIDHLLELKAEGNKKTAVIEPLEVPNTITAKYIALKVLKKKKNFTPFLYGSAELDTTEGGRNNRALENYYDLGYPIVRKN